MLVPLRVAGISTYFCLDLYSLQTENFALIKYCGVRQRQEQRAIEKVFTHFTSLCHLQKRAQLQGKIRQNGIKDWPMHVI